MRRLPALAFLLGSLPGGTALAAESATRPDLALGRAVYERWCTVCHAPGRGHPGTEGLALKYGGTRPAVLLERTDLAPEAVAAFVRQGVLAMAPYRKTEISDVELAALAAYVARNFEGQR